ncbi:MAG: hypothetical protein CVU89_01755 [Firmicutes bacterium HGW-Firmicutes-14]|nr:MAG: hypothetical protein CVU89_01755 [Firmicutes bacterium HGW-Firmicutes-14]
MKEKKLNLIFILFWLIALLLVPPLFPRYLLHVFIIAHIYAAFALSWDLLAGYVGELSLGHSLFFGLGAYSIGYLSGKFGVDPWLSIGISCIVTVVWGLLIGLPCLRLRGPYLAIVTLAFQMLFFLLANSLYNLTGGEEGIRNIERVFNSTESYYYLSVFLVIIAFIICYLLVSSKYGLIFRTIRENPEAAEAAGVNIVNYKMLGYMVSALIAGLAGSYQALYLKIATPDTLSMALTFSAITIVAIGGKGTLVGAVLGSYVTTFIFDRFAFLKDYKMLMYSIVLVLCVLFFRNGLAGAVKRVLLWRKMGVDNMPGGGKA